MQAEDQPGKMQLFRKCLSVLGNKLKVGVTSVYLQLKNVTENRASLKRVQPAGPWKRLPPSTLTGTASAELFQAAKHKRNIVILEQVQQRTTTTARTQSIQ